MEEPPRSRETSKEGLAMYFDEKVAALFAEREQNEKNFRVAAIVDRLIMSEIAALPDPIHAAELGGGAHPDRYNSFFARLLREPQGHIDWVDISPHMLKFAERYISNPQFQARKEVIQFIESDIVEYLEGRQDEGLDLAIMKYTIDHIKDMEDLMRLFSKKLKRDGRVVATIGMLRPELKSVSTNARFLYNGEEFPENEVRILKDGDTYTVKFYKESGNPAAGFLEGAETTKYYHSSEKIRVLAEQYGLEAFLGDWKQVLSKEQQEGETMDQEVIVLRKP